MRTLSLVSILALSAACAPRVEYVRADTRAAPVAIASEVGDLVLRAGPASEFSLMTLLNGEPTLLGVLTSTGTSVTNASTAVPFTVAAGSVLLFKCDAGSANVGGGATCDTTVTGASHKYQLANAYDPYFMVLKSTTVCLDAPAATTINCAVFRMQGP
jgi:hypothetical protein